MGAHRRCVWPLSSRASVGSALVLKPQASLRPFNVKSTNSVSRSSKRNGATSRDVKTSRSSAMQQFLFPMSGQLDFPAKMSRWREWALEQGLKEADLDCFMTLLASLEKDAPELFYSKT